MTATATLSLRTLIISIAATLLLLIPSGVARANTTCLTEFSFDTLKTNMGLELIATGQTEEQRHTITADWYANAAGQWIVVYTSPRLSAHCIIASGFGFHLYSDRHMGICREEDCSPA